MILPRKAHAVVFDMDGLIFDTEALYRDAIFAAAGDWGLDMPHSVILASIGLSTEASREVYWGHFGREFDWDAFWKVVTARFHAMAGSQLRLKAGVLELLDALDTAALPRAIATSSRPEDARHHLAAHGILDRFHSIVARGGYPRAKPHPDPYLEAASRLNVEPTSCVALEDSYNGVRAASSAGMMTIMVPDLLAATPEMETLCIGIARDLHEVRALLNIESPTFSPT